MGNGWGYALAVIAVVVGGWLWDRWRGDDEDPEYAQREGEFGWRLVLAAVATLALLAVALILAGLGLKIAAWAAFGLVFLGIALVYVGPWLGPRRKR